MRWRLKRLWKRFGQPSILTTIAASVFVGVGIGIVLYGFFYTQNEYTWLIFVEQVYSNLGIELGSIGLTVLVIERLNHRAAIAERKEELILQMGSPNNAFAVEAVRILRQKRWLYDGSLELAYLAGANLQGANLAGANLYTTELAGANLQGANLNGANLYMTALVFHDTKGQIIMQAKFDETTILPDGSKWSEDRDMDEFVLPLEWLQKRF